MKKKRKKNDDDLKKKRGKLLEHVISQKQILVGLTSVDNNLR